MTEPSHFILTRNLKRIRVTVTPYLPPPVIKLITTTNTSLKPYTNNDEGFMILLFTLLVAYIIYTILTTIKRIFQSRYNVLADDDDDVIGLLSKKKDVSSTVLLCGISGSGKTVLFHKLSECKDVVTTLPSLKAAEEYVTNNETTIQLIDYPGHPTLRSSLPLLYPTKILFLLDSSKSITESAHFLFHILTTKITTTQKEMLIVCNKADLPLAKNLKRIKLQLRTELERLRKVKVSSLGEDDDDLVVVPKKSFDLDTSEGLQYNLSFLQSSCVGDHVGFQEIQNFCW